MAKFGRRSLYRVSYDEIWQKIIGPALSSALNPSSASNDNLSPNRFQTEWRNCLQRACLEFEGAIRLFWEEVFDAITKAETKEVDLGGLLPAHALSIYVDSVSTGEARELLCFLKGIHDTALSNVEALRMLVSELDELYRGQGGRSLRLSGTLLPEVYSSNFTVAIPTLEGALELLRRLLGVEGGDGDVCDPNDDQRLDMFHSMNGEAKDVIKRGYFSEDVDAHLVRNRKEESKWLTTMVKGMNPVYIPFLVAHRGFHSIHDRCDVRPLENTLMAYEAAWAAGLHLCECDIALTKDEIIILAHDENFSRLGLDPTHPLCNCAVQDLTFTQLMNCSLKSGERPSLLFDVLKSAVAIDQDAKMIVEIKAGNTGATSGLARMFVRHPQLMDHVAAIMSFDVSIMHDMRREMAVVFEHFDRHSQLNDAKKQTTVCSSNGPKNLSSIVGNEFNITPEICSNSRVVSSDQSGLSSEGSLNNLMDKHQQLSGEVMPSESAQLRVFPKLLLITLAQTPIETDFVHIDITDPDMPSKLDRWLRYADGGTLDGVYMQFQTAMLEVDGSSAMCTLASRYTLGIWGANPVPDDWETFYRLVTECDVKYVNSGLPRHFRQK